MIRGGCGWDTCKCILLYPFSFNVKKKKSYFSSRIFFWVCFPFLHVPSRLDPVGGTFLAAKCPSCTEQDLFFVSNEARRQ